MDAFGTSYSTLEATSVMSEIYCIYRPENFINLLDQKITIPNQPKLAGKVNRV